MGGSKQKSETKPVFSKELQGAYGAVNNAYNQQAPKINAAADKFSGLSDDLLSRYMDGADSLSAARGYNADVLSGKYLGANPYLDDVIAQGSNDTVNATQAAMGLRGLTGGSDYAGLIADRVGRGALATRYADYDQERNRMATAAGQSPGIDLAAIAPAMGAGQLGASLPMNAASQYAGSVGGLLGPYTRTTQQQNPGLFDWMGMGIQAASLFSDARLKEDIRQVGQTDAGLPVYTFKYRGDPATHMGVMAQDVEREQPEALGDEREGYMTVDYGKVR